MRKKWKNRRSSIEFMGDLELWPIFIVQTVNFYWNKMKLTTKKISPVVQCQKRYFCASEFFFISSFDQLKKYAIFS